MYKSYRYINAGTNEFYRYGRKAQERLAASLNPNKDGWYSIECDAGAYWTIGTSEGKFGEYAKYKNTFFSVKDCGIRGRRIYVHQDSSKFPIFLEMINGLLQAMKDCFKSDEEEIEENEEYED